MGRFDKFFDEVAKKSNPQIEPGDETTAAENPRNWLTGHINQVLPDTFQIPAQTVAEDKQYMQNLPEMMGAGTMGSIGEVGAAGRFGRILGAEGTAAKGMSHADIMAHPEMVEFMQNAKNFKNANPHPSQYDSAKQALINKLRGL